MVARVIRFFCLWLKINVQDFTCDSMSDRINNFMNGLSESPTESSMCIVCRTN